MSFNIIRNDITKVRADAIVNTANPKPVFGSGTDSAIYKAAGEQKLLEERRKIGNLEIGEVAVTPAFDLPARYIIHTVGPVWRGGDQGEFKDLESCYKKSLLIARHLQCKSIAFPLISTGVYGFPKDKALNIALDTFRNFLKDDDMDIILVVFDKKSFEISSTHVNNVKQFIDDGYYRIYSEKEYTIGTRLPGRLNQWKPNRKSRYHDSIPEEELSEGKIEAFEEYSSKAYSKASSKTSSKRNLKDVVSQIDETFQERLFRIIDEKGMNDTEVYKKANVDRKLFSKIRCNKYYKPKKKTAMSLAVALELNLDETLDLLRRAGYALSPSSKFDIILTYCIENHIYDMFDVNALLFEYTQEQLG